MKIKNKIISLGTALAIVAPITTIISCGSSQATKQNESQDTSSFTNSINGADGIYKKDYDYNNLLSNNKSGYDASDGTLTIDLAALRKFAGSYPVDGNKFNEKVWSDLTKESVRQQLLNAKKTNTSIDVEAEMKKVSADSSPLTVQTDSVYYPYFSTTTPNESGNSEQITPGFYHIRPESKTDVLATDGTEEWNRIATKVTTGFKEQIKLLTDKVATHNKLTEGDQIILNTTPLARTGTSLTSKTYTYYENSYDVNGVKGPLDKPGFFITKPLSKDGAGVLKITNWKGEVTEYSVKGEQNYLNFDNFNETKSGSGIFEVPTFILGTNHDVKKSQSFVITKPDTPAFTGNREHNFSSTFKWDAPSPIIYRHFLDEYHQTKELKTEGDVEKLFNISKTDKSQFEFLQPDSNWIAPGSGFRKGVDTDSSTLSYNNHQYKLTRAAERISSIYQKGYFYNPANLRYLDSDSLNWIDLDESPSTKTLPTALQTLLLAKSENHLDGFDGQITGKFGGNQYTLYSKFESSIGEEMPDELQGFYLKRPKNEVEAREKMFNSTNASSDISDTDGKAIPYNITKVGTTIKINDNGAIKEVKYWNPSNLGSFQVEMLYGSAKRFETNEGFELTGMITKEKGFMSTTIITQQDKGFAPITNAGSWESSMAAASSGSEKNLYKFADFIEDTNSDAFYYQHEYFNYDNGVKLDLRSMTSDQREKYRLPSILRGFYKNNTKLDFKEYNDAKDNYIISSLNSSSLKDVDGKENPNQHNKLIFNGLYGSKSVTTYKGIIYENKSISGLVAHTSWSPRLKSFIVVYGEKQDSEWFRSFDNKKSDGTIITKGSKIDKPDDYFNLSEAYFGHNIISNKETVKGFLSEIANVPFENINRIKFVWNEETLATIKVSSHIDFERILQILKSPSLFDGNINTVKTNIGFIAKNTFDNTSSKNVAELLFGETKDKYPESVMGRLAAKLGEYTEVKDEFKTEERGVKDA